jgi:hypothetical protein
MGFNLAFIWLISENILYSLPTHFNMTYNNNNRTQLSDSFSDVYFLILVQISLRGGDVMPTSDICHSLYMTCVSYVHSRDELHIPLIIMWLQMWQVSLATLQLCTANLSLTNNTVAAGLSFHFRSSPRNWDRRSWETIKRHLNVVYSTSDWLERHVFPARDSRCQKRRPPQLRAGTNQRTLLKWWQISPNQVGTLSTNRRPFQCSIDLSVRLLR